MMKTNLIWAIVFSLFLVSCEKERTLFVAENYGECENGTKNECLLIREKTSDPYVTFSGKIEGFEYEPGFLYKIKVKIIQSENKTLKYELVEILSKISTLDSLSEQSEKTSINNNWEVIKLNGYDNSSSVKPFFTLKDNKINGNNGCNTFGGSFEMTESGSVVCGNLMATKMYCEETAALENHFSEQLLKTKKYELFNSVLTFYDENDTELMVMHPKTQQVVNEDKEVEQTKQFELIYNISSRGFSQKWIYKNGLLQINNSGSEKISKAIKLRTKEKKKLESILNKMEPEKLELLTPPSTKHQFDGAKLANLVIKVNDNTYHIPPFDHKNPNPYIQDLMDILSKLASE